MRERGRSQQPRISKRGHFECDSDSGQSDTDTDRSNLGHSFRKGKENQENRRFSQYKYNPMPKTRSYKKKVDQTLDENPDQTGKEESPEDKIARLQAELAAKKCLANGKIDKNTDLTVQQKRWIGDVKMAVKEYIWGSVKFINDERKLVRVTEGLFDLWNLKVFEKLAGKAK